MVDAQMAKYVVNLAPISVAGGGTATVTEIDTIGWDYAEVIITTGLVGANGVTVLKITESDTAGSGHTDISGGGFTALVDANDGIINVAYLDLRKHKRYLNTVITNGATNASLLSCIVRLSRGKEMPNSNTERGTLETLTP